MALIKFWQKFPVAWRFIGAALGGLLLSAAFPRPSLAGAAWVAPGVILFCALGVRGGQAFRIGFVGGLVHFLSSLYWLLNMPFTWHGIPLAPALGWIALSAYCALYPAAWVWFCWRFFPGNSNPQADQFLLASWLQRQAWFIGVAALWTVLEFVRGRFMTGFPWNFVAASQYKLLPLIQVAAVTGIYGVSFIVVWTSVSLCAAALAIARKPTAQNLWAGAGLPLLAVVAAMSFGFVRLLSVSPPGKELKVGMVQPGIPQTEIWDSSKDMARFQTVLDLSEKALASGPQLLLWPESAVPDLTPEIQQSIARMTQSHRLWLVFCSGTDEPSPAGGSAYYNSALLCNPDGMVEAIYHKRRLVIFGEYIPLVRWLPFLKFLTPVGEGLTAGERPVEFELKNPAAKLSVLICFEDVFPQEAREHAGPDTDFLVNLTNDGWFGHDDEQWQQAASSIFRAIENGIPLLRCTNDGLTCWADGRGRLRQILNTSGNVYGPGFITADIPLRGPGERQQTFYNQYGDWFPWTCACASFAWLVAIKLGRGRTGRDSVQN